MFLFVEGAGSLNILTCGRNRKLKYSSHLWKEQEIQAFFLAIFIGCIAVASRPGTGMLKYSYLRKEQEAQIFAIVEGADRAAGRAPGHASANFGRFSDKSVLAAKSRNSTRFFAVFR